jgi:hypothetical protein
VKALWAESWKGNEIGKDVIEPELCRLNRLDRVVETEEGGKGFEMTCEAAG